MIVSQIVKVIAKANECAVSITRERIAAGHPEKVCNQDMQDWLAIIDRCANIEEIQIEFENWAVRAEAYYVKMQGMLH